MDISLCIHRKPDALDSKLTRILNNLNFLLQNKEQINKVQAQLAQGQALLSKGALPGGAPSVISSGTMKIAAAKILSTADIAEVDIGGGVKMVFNNSIFGGSSPGVSLVDKSKNFTIVKVHGLVLINRLLLNKQFLFCIQSLSLLHSHVDRLIEILCTVNVSTSK